ncbi:unnamed protein product, partial [Didymodactylos carnosus]
YRGQGISEEELTLIRENIGEFISMNSFLSTSTIEQTGQFYSEANKTENGLMKCILFKFDIDCGLLNARPFAYIVDHSQFPEENEVLIALGTIFRIKEVTYNSNEKTWIANLTLCTEDDFVLKPLLEYEKNRLGQNPDFISLGQSLSHIGRYEQAKNLFQQIINESTDDLERIICYHHLIDINRYERKWDEAYKNYMKLPVPQENNHPGMEKYIGYIHASIAELYFWKEEFDMALDYCKTSLSLIPKDHSFLVKPYHIMGTTFMAKDQYELALKFLNKAFDIQEKYLPEDHPSFGETYNYMAVTYEQMKDYLNAFEFYNKCLRIYKKSLPPSHPNIQNNENNLKCLEVMMNNH